MALRMTQPYEAQENLTAFQLSDFQRDKVLTHLKLVKWIVTRIVDRFTALPPHIESGDLIHSGILGLIDAVRRFSWGREKEEEEFNAYAECRIRGQVMDELRQSDVLPRSARDKVKQYRKVTDVLRQQLKREPTELEVCDFLKVDIETCHKLRAEANFGKKVILDTSGGSTSETMEGILRKTLNLIDPNSPEALFHLEEVKKILVEEIEALNERERMVISLYYYDELTLKEIGQVLSITESRVSQIHSQSLTKLTRRLKQAFGLEQPLEEM